MTFIQRLRYWFNCSPRPGWTRAKVYGYTINGWDLVKGDNTVVARIVLVDGFWEVIDFRETNACFAFEDYVDAMVYCEVEVHKQECIKALSAQSWYGQSIAEQILASNQPSPPPQDDWLEFVKKL